MTTITQTTSQVTTGAAAPSSAEKASMDYDAFLQLFIAQMKNQDPMNPNDPTQSLAQLASFSNVEQSIKLNEKLDRLIAVSDTTLASAIIGRQMSNLDDSISGVVVSVENGPTGLSAILDSGATLLLSDGYRLTGHE